MRSILEKWVVQGSAVSGRMKVYPLFREHPPALDYLWAGDAMKSGAVVVTDDSGEQQLTLRSYAPRHVLFLEGVILDHGHQNRGLNASFLIAPGTSALLPVSCVEKGRSTGESPVFDCSDTFVPSSVRCVLKREVTQSLCSGDGHRTSRHAVWGSIKRSISTSMTRTETESVIEISRQHGDSIEAVATDLPYRAGARGLAVAYGSRILELHLFDRPETCARMWTPIVSACISDTLSAGDSGPFLTRREVRALVARLAESHWLEFAASPGVGSDFRSRVDQHLASALVFRDELIHASVVLAA